MPTHVQPADARAPTAQACEFLGMVGAPDQKGIVPWPEHRCFSASEPVEIGRSHQGFFCLTSGHTDCPRYILGQNMKKAKEPASTPEPRLVAHGLYALRTRGQWVTTWSVRVALAATVVLTLIGLEFAVVRSTAPTAARSQSLAQPATNAPQITTVTLQPPSRTPTPVPTSTPSARPGQLFSAPNQPASSGPSLTVPMATNGQTMFTMQPGGGPAGSAVTIMGVNWAPNSDVALGWGLQPDDTSHRELATARTNANGSFTATPRLPSGIAGTVFVSVRQADRVATAPFQVTP